MIENCPHCGGAHYGSHKCPFLPDAMEANKRAADEGFWRKHRESGCPPFDQEFNERVQAVARILQEEAASDPTFPVRGLANYAAVAERIMRAVRPTNVGAK